MQYNFQEVKKVYNNKTIIQNVKADQKHQEALNFQEVVQEEKQHKILIHNTKKMEWKIDLEVHKLKIINNLQEFKGNESKL